MATRTRTTRKKRGVSLADYELYRRMVVAGKTTWRKLEKLGKVLPPRRAWRQAKVLKAISKRKGV